MFTGISSTAKKTQLKLGTGRYRQVHADTQTCAYICVHVCYSWANIMSLADTSVPILLSFCLDMTAYKLNCFGGVHDFWLLQHIH